MQQRHQVSWQNVAIDYRDDFVSNLKIKSLKRLYFKVRDSFMSKFHDNFYCKMFDLPHYLVTQELTAFGKEGTGIRYFASSIMRKCVCWIWWSNLVTREDCWPVWEIYCCRPACLLCQSKIDGRMDVHPGWEWQRSLVKCALWALISSSPSRYTGRTR